MTYEEIQELYNDWIERISENISNSIQEYKELDENENKEDEKLIESLSELFTLNWKWILKMDDENGNSFEGSLNYATTKMERFLKSFFDEDEETEESFYHLSLENREKLIETIESWGSSWYKLTLSVDE